MSEFIPIHALNFFTERLGTCFLGKFDRADLDAYFTTVGWNADEEQLREIQAFFDALSAQSSRDDFELDELFSHCYEQGDTTLVVQALPDPKQECLSPFMLVIALQSRPKISQQFVRSTVEAWFFQRKVSYSQTALRDSAMQLAQSFEEQNWLRSFAKHASSFSRTTQANEIATGILQPLVYLLRAEDVFLITSPEERDRSGLASSKYSASAFSIQEIEHLLVRYQFNGSSKPLVLNNVSIAVDGGRIDSVVAVPIQDATNRGALVAINRRAKLREADGDLPVYDHEFGSVEVGILEEAAVLLTTQAHNLQLLLQSNQLFLGTLHAMSSAIDARDKYTQGHSERVARLALDLARILELSTEACHEIYLAGILHDIGKIGIPDRVLLKAGRLTDEEYSIIQKHPEIGHNIVERMQHLQFTLPGVLHHHERWDGKGYPHGLQGTATPLMARILAVADSFDAMTSSRPYRSAMHVDKAHLIINQGAGKQWDADIVHCFNEWFKNRTSEFGGQSLRSDSGTGFIPQDRPFEQMALAVTALN